MISVVNDALRGTADRQLCFFFLCGWLLCSPVQALPQYLGDLDEDGQATVLDLVRLVNHVNGSHSLSNAAIFFADLNEDGFINDADAKALGNVILGLAPLRALPLARVRESSPSHGESGVAVTRETIFRLTQPLSTNVTLTTSNVFAEFGGRRWLSRVELSSDRRTVTLFYLEYLPASARVRVTFDGAGLTDFLGRPVDLDGDGAPGGAMVVDFDTLSITPLTGTAVIGQVLASDQVPGTNTTNFVNRPLEGVTVSVDGAEETLRTVTDSQGRFTLSPAPAGRFFVHVDGRTAADSHWPTGAYYPLVGKAWEAIPGRTNNLAGGSGLIYLPLITTGTLQTVSMTQDTTITFPASVVATHPALQGVSITVPANSLFSDNGTRGGMVGIAPVPPDRLPEVLPPMFNFPLVITIQTDGPANFDRPVPVRFPNLPNPITGQPLLPNSKSALWSFNHDTGKWEIQGPMTVTADGLFVESDPGVGVRQPGWHGTQPGSSGGGGGSGGPGGNGDGDGDGDDDDDSCDKEEKKAISGAVQCGVSALLLIPKFVPLVGCAVSVGQSVLGAAADCIIDFSSCGTTIVKQGIGAGLGCIPVVGGVNGYLYQCVYQMGTALSEYQMCLAQPSSSSMPLGASSIPENIFFEHNELWADAAALYSTILGDPKWTVVIPEELDRANAFLQALLQSIQVGTPLDERIDPTEKNALLQLPLPTGITVQDASALVDRIDLIVAGQLPDLQLMADAAAAQGTKLQQTILELQSRGWQTTYDLFLRGLPELSMLVDQTFSPGSSGSLPATLGPAAAAQSQLPINFIRKRPLFFRLTDLFTGFVQRGRLTSQGVFDEIILAADTLYYVEYVDPVTLKNAVAVFMSGPSGSRTKIPRAKLSSANTPDSDNDGLSDEAEAVIGTSPNVADTDGDGILDGTEVQQGSNPLDGLPASAGIIASRDTPGSAVDVVAVNNIAVVADGDAGISVFNVVDPRSPVLVSQVDTPGFAHSVTVSGNFVAVADDSGGLAIIDISDPPAAKIVRRVGFLDPVWKVLAAGKLVYVASRANVYLVELESGTILDQRQFASGTAFYVHDLALSGDFLFVLTGQVREFDDEPPGFHTIHKVAVGPILSPDVATVTVPGTLRRVVSTMHLVAGGGLLYVGTVDHLATNGLPGIEIFADTSSGIAVIGAPSPIMALDLAVNGSGLAVFVGVAPISPDKVGLLDVHDPTQTDQFLTSFDTPGQARAVSIYNGLAYIADNTAGLQVLNYMAYDSLGVPPTIALSVSASNGIAVEGQPLRMTALVTDDVQVRNVEFYVDDVRVLTDGNFPFEHRLQCPNRTPTKTNFVVKAKATDTGGNVSWSETLVIALASDLQPPSVTRVWPPAGSGWPTGQLAVVTASFSEAMQAASLDSQSFLVFGAGPDQLLGTADDSQLAGVVTWRDEIDSAFLTFATAIPPGLYRAVVKSNVSDMAGNRLGADFSWSFDVAGPVFWKTNASGFWDETAKWSSGTVPGPNDVVLIDRPAGPYVVTHRSGNNAVRALTSTEAFVLSGGTLTVSNFSQLENTFQMSGGTRSGSGEMIVFGPGTWNGGTFSGGGSTRFQGGIMITGTANVFISGHTVVNAGFGIWNTPSAGILFQTAPGRFVNAIDSNFDIQGDLVMAYNGINPPFPRFENAGALVKSAGTNIASINKVTFYNSGSVEVTRGTLRFLEATTNSGSFEVGPLGKLMFSSGIHSFSPTASIAGAGAVQFASDAVVAANYDVAGETWIAGGLVNFNGPVLNAGSILNVTAGRANFNNAQVAVSGIVNVTGGQLYLNNLAPVTPSSLLVTNLGILGGLGEVVVTGALTWSGGTMTGSGLSRAEAALHLNSSGTKYLMQSRTLENAGLCIWSGAGDVLLDTNAVFNNLPAAWFEAQNDAAFAKYTFVANGGFNNAGTFIKSGGVGTTRISVPFNNSGTTIVQVGKLLLQGGGNSSGIYKVPSSNTLEFGGGIHALGPGSVMDAQGTVQFSGAAAVTNNGTYQASFTDISGGRAVFNTDALSTTTKLGGILAGTGTFTTTGAFTWTNTGTMRDGGVTEVLGPLVIHSASALSVDGRVINMAGNSIWNGAGSITMINNAVITNRADATFEVRNDATIGNDFESNPPRFVNAGAFRKTSGPGSTLCYCRFLNSGSVEVQSGTLFLPRGYIQSAGVTLLSGGSIQMNASQNPGLELQGGLLTGSGVISARVTNNAAISPGASAGYLAINYEYRQGPNGILNIEIGGLIARTNYDQVAVSGAATLDGTLNVSLIDGFEPSFGDAFVVLTCATRTNTFAVINGLSIGNGKQFQPVYTTTNLTLQVISSP
jgi:hypothetical protein